jgi:hypothetical protein
MNSKRQMEEGKQEAAMVRVEHEQQETDWRNKQIKETGKKDNKQQERCEQH